MWYLILFFMAAGTLGAIIGYMVETSLSMTTEVLVGVSMVVAIGVVVQMALRVIRPCLVAIDEAFRDAEESAGQ